MAISDNPGPDEGLEEPDSRVGEKAGEPDPSGGGCLRLGWGCLPVLIGGALILPGSLLF